MSNNTIQLKQELIHNELKDFVKNSVEETLNALLEHEAENLVNAQKYERFANRQGGHRCERRGLTGDSWRGRGPQGRQAKLEELLYLA